MPDLPKILTTERLGPKQSLTPEGFLLCQDAIVARTGVMDYAAMELPDLQDKDGVVEVVRDEAALFNPETLASFEGKPVCLEHPYEPVNPRNWSIFAKGVMKNVRQGDGAQSNLMLADLLITDSVAIEKIRSKEITELSNGYDAAYEQIAPGRARQTSIVGNHTALVKAGRCGPICAVQDSTPSLGDQSMATKKGAESLKDKLRKLFMTRDSEAFEKALSDEVKDEGMEGAEGQHIHIHMPGAEKQDETKDDESEAADPMAQVMDSLKAIADSVAAIGERVTKLEAGPTNDSEEEKKDEETKDDDGDGDDAETQDSDDEEEKKDDEKKSTSDSASLRDEFQDAKARAEILAPGVKLPTFDAKAAGKKTSDSLCVLRRRALKAALTNDNAAIVKSVVGKTDVSKMTCDAAAMAFNAASEMVKAKNKTSVSRTVDSQAASKDINQIHADFWNQRKA